MRRRAWLVSGAAGAGALLVGWAVLPPRSRIGSTRSLAADDTAVTLNGWIKVSHEGDVLLAMNRSEMGQGVHTALAMLVAEELDVNLSRVRLTSAGEEALYGNVALFVSRADGENPAVGSAEVPVRARLARHVASRVGRALDLNLTGGSTSVADAWDVLRLAAATARSQLLNAASLEWRLPVAELEVSDGMISHPSGRRAPYPTFAERARITPPGRVEPKPASAWTLIGQPLPRLEGPAKADGRAVFGIDERLPGQLFAVVRHAPTLGGSPGRVDAAAALRLPGVERVVRLPPYAGAPAAIAVVGITSWHAQRGADALRIEWRRAAPPDRADTARAELALEQRALEDGFAPVDETDQAGRRLLAVYRLPYLAHAALEPVNATARVSGGRVDLWVPTQVPGLARATAARVAGVDEAAVQVEVSYLGGSFGRRLETEVVAQAVRIAMECGGRPVQALWLREQDFANDVFRPAAVVLLQAELDPSGRPLALHTALASDAVTPRWIERNLPQLGLPLDLPGSGLGESPAGHPYAISRGRRIDIDTRAAIPVGYWRAVRHSAHTFAVESFIDELAAAAAQDPVRFRLALLEHQPRHAAVLAQAAERAGWPGFGAPSQPLAPGRARGVALHAGHGSVVAQVAEVSMQNGRVRVHRVVVAADVGLVVNSQIVAQQLEGGVICGLSAALHGRIDVVDGAVVQTNFDRYRLLTLAEAPRIETHLLASSQAPGGVGEIANPAIAPAVANALSALTGKRWRDLPLVAGS